MWSVFAGSSNGFQLQEGGDPLCNQAPIASCAACAEKYLIRPFAEGRWGFADNLSDVREAWTASACDALVCEQLRVKYNIRTGTLCSLA